MDVWSAHPWARRVRLRILQHIADKAPSKKMKEVEDTFAKLLAGLGFNSLDELRAAVEPNTIVSDVSPALPFAAGTALLAPQNVLPANDADMFGEFAKLAGLNECQRMFQLDFVSARLLALSAQCALDPVLAEFGCNFYEITPRNWSQVVRLWAYACALPERVVAAAVATRGVLARSMLVRFERRHGYNFEDRAELHETALEYFCAPERDIQRITDRYFNACAPAQFTLPDFAHLDLERLIAMLRPAPCVGPDSSPQASTPRPPQGRQILLYGPPGTGKTALCAALAEHLGMALFSVPTADAFHEPIEHQARLQAFSEAQRVLAKRTDALLLFDEVEDVIRSGDVGRDKAKRPVSFKGWLHEQLETAPVPAIWVSNSVDCFDPAQLRRFACILQVPVPALAARKALCSLILAPLNVSAPLAERVSNRADIAPADVHAAVREAALCAAPAGALVLALDARLSASGRERLGTLRATGAFDFGWLNADLDLAGLVTSLSASGAVDASAGARILLHGPPGTGKTAFASALAAAQNAPLLDRCASDLVSPYVGQTEINLAECFRDAQQDRSVLLLDEIDGFLRARLHAQRSYEVSQVNELLKQLERFDGVFIAATNTVDALDPAALRRFDFVVKLDWPCATQRQNMLAHYVARWQLPRTLSDDALAAHARQLHWLTPGDFAALERRVRMFASSASDASVLAWLKAACAMKPEGKNQRIGFAC
jgi:transitional endoplasmic reticulum ATPase